MVVHHIMSCAGIGRTVQAAVILLVESLLAFELFGSIGYYAVSAVSTCRTYTYGSYRAEMDKVLFLLTKPAAIMEPMAQPGEKPPSNGRLPFVTQILSAIRQDQPGARDRLLELVYGELYALARRRLAREGGNKTLQPTALVNEAWIRLFGGDLHPDPPDRGRDAERDQGGSVNEARASQHGCTHVGTPVAGEGQGLDSRLRGNDEGAGAQSTAGGGCATSTAGGDCATPAAEGDCATSTAGGVGGPFFENRRHFFAAAAKAMHRICVDYARKRRAAKRGGRPAAADMRPEGGEDAAAEGSRAPSTAGGGCAPATAEGGRAASSLPAAKWVSSDAEIATFDRDPTEVLALDEALARLAKEDPELVEIVRLRYFVELSLDDTAKVLGISRRTVANRWRLARAWLHRALES